MRCNCNELAFADNCFDMAKSTQMPGHLEENVYFEAIAELCSENEEIYEKLRLRSVGKTDYS
jgi:hypothetical protein